MNMKPIVAVDMDGVVARFTDQAIQNIKLEFNIDLSYEDIKIPSIGDLVWMRMSEEQKKKFNTKKDIYNVICPAGFFYGLQPYDNSADAIKILSDCGFHIVFLTKPLSWDESSFEKTLWLNNYFYDVDYSVIMVSDMESKHLVSANVFIDDDPRALARMDKYSSICIEQPWNEEYREKSYEGFCCKNIFDAALFIRENKKFFMQLDKGGLDAPKN